jgi:hypothetical protein
MGTPTATREIRSGGDAVSPDMENPTARTTCRRTRPRAGRGVVATASLAALALVLAACGDDGDDATTAGAADAGGGGDELSIDLVQPADGDEVDDTFDVEVDTGVELGEPDTGLHHVHLYYDGETADGEYDLVYGTTFTVERDLGAGEHTVEAVIANADHSLTDARDEVTVTVGDGAAPAGDDSTDDSQDDSGGYDY